MASNSEDTTLKTIVANWANFYYMPARAAAQYLSTFLDQGHNQGVRQWIVEHYKPYSCMECGQAEIDRLFCLQALHELFMGLRAFHVDLLKKCAHLFQEQVCLLFDVSMELTRHFILHVRQQEWTPDIDSNCRGTIPQCADFFMSLFHDNLIDMENGHCDFSTILDQSTEQNDTDASDTDEEDIECNAMSSDKEGEPIGPSDAHSFIGHCHVSIGIVTDDKTAIVAEYRNVPYFAVVHPVTGKRTSFVYVNILVKSLNTSNMYDVTMSKNVRDDILKCLHNRCKNHKRPRSGDCLIKGKSITAVYHNDSHLIAKSYDCKVLSAQLREHCRLADGVHRGIAFPDWRVSKSIKLGVRHVMTLTNICDEPNHFICCKYETVADDVLGINLKRKRLDQQKSLPCTITDFVNSAMQ